MGLSFASRIRCSPDLLLNRLCHETVAFHGATGQYFGLDAVAGRMLDVVTSAQTLEEAYCTLLEEFDVEPERLRRDLLACMESLLEAGLVELS